MPDIIFIGHKEKDKNIEEKIGNLVNLIKSSRYVIDTTKETFHPKYNKEWWNTICSKYVAKRRQTRRLFLAHLTDENKQKWRLWENKTKNYIKVCKQEVWKKYVSSINSRVSNKVVFKKINALRSKVSITNTTLYDNNTVITDPQIKANIFVDHFFPGF